MKKRINAMKLAQWRCVPGGKSEDKHDVVVVVGGFENIVSVVEMSGIIGTNLQWKYVVLVNDVEVENDVKEESVLIVVEFKGDDVTTNVIVEEM
jgi:hypothetical protein